MHQRVADRGGGIEQVRRECVDRERWRFFCHGHALGDVSTGNEASETIETDRTKSTHQTTGMRN